MPQHDDGDFLHPEFARSENSGVPRKDAVVAIDQNRICPAKFQDRRRDLRDLLPAVGARVIRPRE